MKIQIVKVNQPENAMYKKNKNKNKKIQGGKQSSLDKYSSTPSTSYTT